MSGEAFRARLEDGATLEGIELHDADLSGTAAYDLVLRDCRFVNADITGVDWEGLRCVSSTFVKCRFSQANLNDSYFERCTFFDLDAETGCTFWNTRLRSAQFTHCNLDGCSFEGADLFRIDVRDSRAVGASFLKADFHGAAKITRSVLTYADLREANLARCDLSQTDLKWALLDGADLREANLMGADLTEATLREATLTGADLRGAVVATLDVRTLDLRGVKIFESQLRELLAPFELIVFPDNR